MTSNSVLLGSTKLVTSSLFSQNGLKSLHFRSIYSSDMAKNGIKIDFDSMLSHKGSHCHNLTYSDKIIIDRDVKKLVDKKVIYECDRVEGDSFPSVH